MSNWVAPCWCCNRARCNLWQPWQRRRRPRRPCAAFHPRNQLTGSAVRACWQWRRPRCGHEQSPVVASLATLAQSECRTRLACTHAVQNASASKSALKTFTGNTWTGNAPATAHLRAIDAAQRLCKQRNTCLRAAVLFVRMHSRRQAGIGAPFQLLSDLQQHHWPRCCQLIACSARQHMLTMTPQRPSRGPPTDWLSTTDQRGLAAAHVLPQPAHLHEPSTQFRSK